MRHFQIRITLAILAALAMAAPGSAQVSAETMKSITTPNKVETQIGTLEFKDGAPSAATAQKVRDSLDYVRGVDAFMNSFSGASALAIRKGFQSIGAEDNTIVIFSELMDANSLFLTANADTIYTLATLDLTKGPLVVEVPPAAARDDQRHVVRLDHRHRLRPAPTGAKAAGTCSCRRVMTVRFRRAVSSWATRRPRMCSTPFGPSWRTTIRNPPSPRSRSR